ncbi:hypothetical protein GQ457_15G017420 [Hibiscus cannabinus]
MSQQDHPVDYCPILQGETSEIVNVVGNFSGPPQMPYNPYSNAYNSEWLDYPNFSYAQNPWPNPTYQPYQPPKSSLESLVERLEQSQEIFLNQTDAHLQEINKQISRIAQSVSHLESRGKLETNSPENVSAITLTSGTVIEQQSQEKHDTKQSKSFVESSEANSQDQGDAKTQKRNSTSEPIQSPHVVQPPFPSRFMKEDKHAEEKHILDLFQKVEINIPLLEVIQKMPRYTRFLKELCANTRKLYGQEKVNLGEHVSVALTRRLPLKLKDQVMFTIPRKIHSISLKEILSWTKWKKWRNYFSQCW